MDNTIELLRRLSEARGVSGNEADVRTILATHIKDLVDDLSSDTMGSLIATKKPSTDAVAASPLKVMIAAHMDEVGLMVTQIDSTGLLRFASVGGIDPRILLGTPFLVGADAIPAVIGLKPIHLLKPEERNRVPELESLYLDIGATSKDSAQKMVQVGDYASFASTFSDLGPTIIGKAMDDRAGCATVCEMLQDSFGFELNAVFTTQEEIGLRGATVATYNLCPDIAIVLEGTVCDDSPKKKDRSPTSILGKGPAITIADNSFIADRALTQLIVDTAEREGIPYQFKRPMIGGTDAGAIHRSRGGVPTAVMAVPCRYIHSPYSIVSKEDLHNLARLLRAVLRRISNEPNSVAGCAIRPATMTERDLD